MFDIIVVHDGMSWQYKKSDQVMRDGKSISADILRKVIVQRLNDAAEVVAIGTASFEGFRKAEEVRANDRARQAADWTRTLVGRHKPIWTLNLGHFTVGCGDCPPSSTGHQRPFVVVGVILREPGAQLEEALRNAIQQTPVLPPVDTYSLFRLSRFQ